jgi:two-component system phosphate regulon sensor histidine kinase PhoR
MNPAAQEIVLRHDLFWHQVFHDIAFQMGETRSFKARFQVDDAWIEAVASPIIANQEDIGIVVTLRDISEEVLTDQMRNAFILQMSHELYTPLVAAKGFTELAAKMSGDQNVQTLLQRSMQGMSTLRDLITQIVDVSRMIKGGFEVTPQELSLETLLNEVIDAYQSQIESKNLRLQVDVGSLRLYTGGREPLRWVFTNLLKNAIDYTLSGGLIKISAIDEDGNCVVRIRDTGVGIARHERARIFEQFYRGQPTAPDGTVIDIRGAGLGLFVVDQVVRAHGGEIEVWSEPGIGSEFTIRLPREREVSKVGERPAGGVGLVDVH